MAADTGEEIIPGLETIPVLPEDHPLFDWADWPESRAALESGVATSRFQKEAWNAIVYALDNALKTAGADPQLLYSLEDSLIPNSSYGRLKASAFNGVRHHIDRFTDFPWPWASDPDSRGYIGTKVFKGTKIEYDETGAIYRVKEGDAVYPEYILELARRVNLLLELMRGTADTSDLAALHAAKALLQSSGAVSGAGVHMGRTHPAQTKIGNLALEEFTGAGFYVKHPAVSLSDAAMEKVQGAGISKWLQFYSKIAASGRAARNEYVLRANAQWLAASAVQAAAEYIYPVNASAQWLSKSLGAVNAAQGQPLSAAGQQISSSAAAIVADAMKDLKTFPVRQQSATGFQIDVKPIQPRFVVVGSKPKTLQQLAILLTRMVEILMYTELDLLLMGGGVKDRARDILMTTGANPLWLLGQGRREAPEELMLHMDPRLLSRAGHISGLFDPRYAYGFDRGIWTASGRTELPEESVLWSLLMLLGSAGSKAETPVARLMQNIRPYVFDASGRLQYPESVKLDALMELDGIADHKVQRICEAFLNWMEWQTFLAGGRPEQPRAVQMLRVDRYWFYASGAPDAPAEIWMFQNPRHVFTGHGGTEVPENLYALSQFHLIGATGAATQEPNAAGLFQVPMWFSVAAGRWEDCEDIYMRALVLLLEYAVAGIDAPAHIQMWQPQSDVFYLSGRLQTPENLRQSCMVPLPGMAAGKVQLPADMLLFRLDRYWFRAGGRLDIPKETHMWSDPTGVRNVSGRTQEPSEITLLALFVQRSMTDAAEETPREEFLRAVEKVICYSAAAQQRPCISFLSGFVRTGGLLDPEIQMPDDQLLAGLSGTVSEGYPSLQIPDEQLLNGIAGTVSRTDAEKALPWAYQGATAGSGILACDPDLQVPDGIRLCVIAGLGAVANASQILRRYGQAIAEFQSHAFLTADLAEPVKFRMLIKSLMVTMANAATMIRKTVPTSGYLAELIGGFVTAELSEAVTLLMATSAGLYTGAGSDIAYVTSVGGAKLQLEIDADMGGYTIRIVATRGRIVIEMPVSYAAADTAAAIRSAGRGIELQIDAQLGGRNAKYSRVQMWAAVPVPEMLSEGVNEGVRAILAAATIGNIELLGQGNLISAVRSDGSTAFEITSVGGGSVQSADGLWADPVQTGSNLHITHVQQSWNDGQKLYIDMDVFYEPVRRGSDLYIRSADSVWTDGSSANIDTEFFLEPVQEGTDLYIRQDIFGGE